MTDVKLSSIALPVVSLYTKINKGPTVFLLSYFFTIPTLLRKKADGFDPGINHRGIEKTKYHSGMFFVVISIRAHL